VDYMIDAMDPSDWDEVRTIYLEGIETGYATFETDPGTWEKWDAVHLKAHRLVARSGSSARGPLVGDSSLGNLSGSGFSVDCSPLGGSLIVGWAALSPASSRPVYAGVTEVSVYVASKCQGHGIGRALLEVLIASAEKGGIWTLQAMIFPENHASHALHLRGGFREVGRREKLGRLHDKWHDVLLLERRSRVVGT